MQTKVQKHTLRAASTEKEPRWVDTQSITPPTQTLQTHTASNSNMVFPWYHLLVLWTMAPGEVTSPPAPTPRAQCPMYHGVALNHFVIWRWRATHPPPASAGLWPLVRRNYIKFPAPPPPPPPTLKAHNNVHTMVLYSTTSSSGGIVPLIHHQIQHKTMLAIGSILSPPPPLWRHVTTSIPWCCTQPFTIWWWCPTHPPGSTSRQLWPLVTWMYVKSSPQPPPITTSIP